MFLPNSRIEQNEDGIYFYEQDILYSEYLFVHDIVLDIILDYKNPGFGIVLFENKYEDFSKSKNKYLIKLGVNEYSVYHHTYSEQKELVHNSGNIALKDGLRFKFMKLGANITIYLDDVKVLVYTMPQEYVKYSLGIYANKNNLLKDMSIQTYTPKLWDLNINNTNGGRFFFRSDTVMIQNCVHDAEIEQSNIFLEKGKYYLTYELSDVDCLCDICAYVFLSSEKEFSAETKNLLDNHNCFVLEEDTYINVRFEGTSGLVKYIALKEKPNDKYVPTYDEAVDIDGSMMIISKLKELAKIKWTGTIIDIPDVPYLGDKNEYFIFQTLKHKYLLSDCHLLLETEYDFEYDIQTETMSIKDVHNTVAFSQIIPIEQDEQLKVFYNITAYIDDLVLIDIHGEEFKPGLTNTKKVYVPDTVDGPILVIDDLGIVFDISASFREVEDKNGWKRFIFTNIEREIFYDKIMKLEKRILNTYDNITIYAVNRDATIQQENIYAIRDGFDNIDKYCDSYRELSRTDYEVFYEDALVEISKNYDDTNVDHYIVDYLKEDSICINKIPDLKTYEVDVATVKKDITFLCDNVDETARINENKKYLLTDIKPDQIKYIYVQKKGLS